MKIVVIGGGAAGMIAAGRAAENKSNEVILVEKNDKLGKKLFITGKGRCNLTNALGKDFLFENTFGNKKFLFPALNNFGIEQTMKFFESLGVKLKVERGGRVFPASDKSQDIINALIKYMKNGGVKIKLNSQVEEIVAHDGKIKAVKTNRDYIECDKIILATGGKSYSTTGSTGDGYIFAQRLGHKIEKLLPSLVPIVTREHYDLQGLSLKNVGLVLKRNDKILYKDFGEMMFTHFGLTGPIILSASRFLLDNFFGAKIYIDLKPALSFEQLDLRLQRDFKKYLNCDFKNSLNDLLPQKLIPVIVNLSGIDPNKKVNAIKKDERKNLVHLLKNFVFEPIDSLGFNNAIVTAGGVSTKEINPSTMQSKIVNGLYFAGEIIDIDALTGGFNLQIAFSTGYLAGSCVQ